MHLCASCSDSYSTHMSLASWMRTGEASALAASSLPFHICSREG